VIVDEAQNFKDRDGNWYMLADILSNQESAFTSGARGALKLRCGYFWVFMDYSQKVHKFKAGLPSVIGRNNFMLSEVSRNSKEIFDFASKFMSEDLSLCKDSTNTSESESNSVEMAEDNSSRMMKRVESSPVLVHEFSTGKPVDVIRYEKEDMKKALLKVLSGLIENGVDIRDLAILVGKRRDAAAVKSSLTSIEEDLGGQAQHVTVDTVRRFSGLDRSAIIGLNPSVNEDHADFNKFMVNLATRARHNLDIRPASDDNYTRLNSVCRRESM
jgi:hypothetical protein